jgi:uncharacterized repeat protein (TIGR01451 family)
MATNPTGPDLTMTKTLSLVNGSPATAGQMVLPGDILTYDIRIENSGGSPATPTLTDRVPAATTYTGPESEGWGPSCVHAPPSPAGTPCEQKVPVPAATAAGPRPVTVQFTASVDEPLPPGTTEIRNVVLASDPSFALGALGTCQGPEPACTAANPTPVPPPPVPPPPVTPPTVSPPTAPPPAVPQPKPAQHVVHGTAFAHGPRECVVSNARIYVTGRQIKSVAFYMDGPLRKLRTVAHADKKGRYLINIKARTLGSDARRIKIVVVFVPSSKTKPKTLHVVVARCPPPRPAVTG